MTSFFCALFDHAMLLEHDLKKLTWHIFSHVQICRTNQIAKNLAKVRNCTNEPLCTLFQLAPLSKNKSKLLRTCGIQVFVVVMLGILVFFPVSSILSKLQTKFARWLIILGRLVTTMAVLRSVHFSSLRLIFVRWH